MQPTATNRKFSSLRIRRPLQLVLACSLTGTAMAAVPENPERNLYYGETHMHTAYSLDAYIGGTRQTPGDAYRAARGEMVVVNGKPHQIRRPLDFAAVTDHAEYMGEMYSTLHVGAPGYDNPLIQQLRGLTDIKDREKWFFKYVISNNRGDTPQHTEFFAGEEGLWRWLQGLEKQGIRGLAIPHNSNASKGMMFPDNDAKGNPIDLEYAQVREHFERAIEMMQVKGNSEVHRKFWAADEFSDFENADSMQQFSGRVTEKRNYVRSGIVKGLALERSLGVNPFKLGFVGGTDNHNGMMSDVDEDNFVGAHGPEDGSIKERREGNVTSWLDSKDLSIGALTGVWAESNTRAKLWDAIYHRETFATSGPRMAVRFFGGWKFESDLHTRADVIKQAYAGGVPMGGDLGKPPGKQAPRFLVMASKDALATATYRNTIGTAQLAAVWEDPEFDPHVPALYYARVIEIPTPRWSTYDAVRSGLPLLDNVAATIQERAWSSPIWYVPNK